MDNDDNIKSEGMKRIENLYKKFEVYCKELVFFGFNSAVYDLKLIKKFLLKNCVCMDSNQHLLSRILENTRASRLNA